MHVFEHAVVNHVSIETIDKIRCIKVKFRGKDGPYFAYGRAYMRVADEDRQLSSKELENLILAKNRVLHRWDSELSEEPLKNIDDTKLKHFVERAGLVLDTTSNALEKLGDAACLLF